MPSVVALGLLRRVAEAANLAEEPRAAMQDVLDAVCRVTGWPIGHASLWNPHTGRMEPTGVWHDESGSAGAFREATEHTSFRSGVGLPGRVHASRVPATVSDVRHDPTFSRASAAASAGIKGAFAFPVLVGEEVAAVLEFYTSEVARLDSPMLDLMRQVGVQLGRVIERDRALRALRLAQERVLDILETAGDCWVAMDAEGRIVGWNRQAALTFGWAREEAIGRMLAETIIPERYREAHHRGVRRFLETGESRVQRRRLQLSALHRDGREFPIELVIWATPAPEDGVSLNAFIRDVTERQAVEEALRRANAELFHANQELEAFSYSASHDLRAPLRAIQGYTTEVLDHERGHLSPESAQMLERTRAAATRMSKLIDDLLMLARVTRAELHRQPVDVAEVARAVIAELAAEAPGRNVDVRAAPTLPAEGDPALLRILLGNLLHNAWKFTGPRDAARIEVGRRAADGAYFVRDNGVGFDTAYAARLFTPFQRLHGREFEGTGVGLAIARRVVDRHGGQIWAEAAVDAGATFYFTLGSADSDG